VAQIQDVAVRSTKVQALQMDH